MKIIMSVLAFVMLLNQPCHAKEDFDWQIDKGMDSTSITAELFAGDFGGKIVVDKSESTTKVDIVSETTEGKEKFTFSVFNKSDNLQNSLTGRVKVPFRFNLLERGDFKLGTEGSLVAGILHGMYGDEVNTNFDFVRLLYGVRNEFVSDFSIGQTKFGLRAGAEVVAADLIDRFGKRDTRWDNYGLRFGAFAKSQFSEKVLFQINANGWRKKYNPEDYFFTEKWTSETKVFSETRFLVNNNVEIVPLLGYRRFDLERDGRVDLEEIQYGGRLVYKTNNPLDTKFFLNTIHASKFQKRGSENVVSVGVESKNWSGEIYQSQNVDSYSDFEIKDSVVAVRLSWRFGGKQKNLDSYKSIDEKYNFYLDNGNEDIKSLTLKQQAERLHSLREQSEWDRNLSYKTEPSASFKNAKGVYKDRSGDCDEQSCTSVMMSALEGYNGYTVAWWDFGKSLIGHAAKIVQDPTNKQWFFVEYGMTFKVDAPSNARVDEVAAAAIKQNHIFSSLPLDNPIDPRYVVIDCNDGQKYDLLTNYISLNGVTSVKRRPNVEYGTELFVGQNFLFD